MRLRGAPLDNRQVPQRIGSRDGSAGPGSSWRRDPHRDPVRGVRRVDVAERYDRGY